ncbi:RHS repeat-associated core domain-containing protein [Fibrobacter sp. UWOV1]|uniref:hypothetical protein n=1 Tax=Fibrobacter sp. UWOV1 TaxID=1896215 RepID=UPI00092421DD|nr:hypothetical protein [Fibrobacter sp. UWOV1]SHL78143.1 RHS repeat-associated core domain-containing protein [Fibrobacter sp. UWOV1]
MENSQDGSLGTLTSLIQHFGLAYFPVTDVQGNIRDYANTSGVQSDPYGALIDLAHDDAEDSRRWQAKEFDSDINKYYFGARFYDPRCSSFLRRSLTSASCRRM